MKIVILPMSLSDYAEAMALWRGMEGIALGKSDTRENIAQYLQRNPGMSFVARANGRLVGTVLCGHDGRRGYIHHLAVAEEFQRQGIGKRLVDQCLDCLRTEGIVKCHIFLEADNHKGEIFWGKIGWIKRTDLKVMSYFIFPD